MAQFKFERMNGYPVGLELDVSTANTEVWHWLREVADQRVYGTTKQRPGEQLQRERRSLQRLPAPYAALVELAKPASSNELRARFHDWLAPLQHPLSVYDHLWEWQHESGP